MSKSLAFGYDFRASLDPATASKRLQHFSARKAHLDAQEDEMELQGLEPYGYGSSRHQYRELLRAHIDFAQAQIREAGDLTAARADAVSSEHFEGAPQPTGTHVSETQSSRPAAEGPASEGAA